MQVSRTPRHFRARMRVMLIASITAATAIMGWLYAIPSAVYSASGPLASAPVAGRPAPPFSVPALTGGGQVTLAQFAGHPLVITFFNSDCGVCWPDMSLLEKAYGRYRSRGLVIVGVGVQDTAGSLRQMIKSLNVTFPVGNDEKGASAARYRLTSIPTTVFVGGDGVVKSVLEGNLDDRTLQKRLVQILPRSASAP
jgi:cytochrome c biogenesis protein CcmG, thiol:disulfide interchange protein DsbE